MTSENRCTRAVGHVIHRARYYNPSNGRFNQRDTFKGDSFDPQSLHKYLYGHSDPVNLIDPSGRYTLVETMAVVFITVLLAVAVFQASYTTVTRTTWRINRTQYEHRVATEIALAQTSALERPKSRTAVRERVKEEADKNPGYLIFLHGTSTGSFPDYLTGKVDFTKGDGSLGPGFYTTQFPLGLLDAAASAYEAESDPGGGIAILLLFRMKILDFESLRPLGPMQPGSVPPGAAIGYDYVYGPYGLGMQYNWQASRGGALLLAGVLPPVILPTYTDWFSG